MTNHSRSWKKTIASAFMVGTALTGMGPSMPASAATATATPIKHVIVLYQENESFDHYFGTYPNAANNAGETSFTGVSASSFTALPDTPSVNGLTPELLSNNPNTNKTATAQTNPQRLLPSGADTCSNGHNYQPEQKAEDSGLMDKFPANTAGSGTGCATDGSTVMDYFDGNTVTALWNYAQHGAMSDNSFGTTFGPSTPGAINLIAGNTAEGILHDAASSGAAYLNPDVNHATDIGDFDAYLDDCGNDKGGTVTTTAVLEMSNGTTNTNKNIGDLLNAAGVTWGWFQGGFAPTVAATLNPDGSTNTPAVCGSSHTAHEVVINGTTYIVPNPVITPGEIHVAQSDYVSHHNPFQMYASTRNPHHLRPTSVAAIGTTDQANHLYDTSDFFAALSANNLPAVSFIKAPSYQNGHPGNSDPLVEQAWLVQTINAIVSSPSWSTTAIIIAWDDSDGWYDHMMGPILTPSNVSVDSLAGASNCGTPQAGADLGRCGRGPRLPLVVISPWAKTNYVDHNLTDQTSIIAFIEKNWSLGFLDGPTAPPEGKGSVDRYAGSIMGMFQFDTPPNLHHPILDPVHGTIVSNN